MNSTINEEIDQWFVKNHREEEHPLNPSVGGSADSLLMFDGSIYQTDSEPNTDIIALSGVEPFWSPAQTTLSSMDNTVGTQTLLQKAHEDQPLLPSFEGAHTTLDQNICALLGYSDPAHDETFSNGFSRLGATHLSAPPDLIPDSSYPPSDAKFDITVYPDAAGSHHKSYSTIDELNFVSNHSILNYRDERHSSYVHTPSTVKNTGNAHRQQAHARPRQREHPHPGFHNSHSGKISSPKVGLNPLQRSTFKGRLNSTHDCRRRQRRIPLQVKEVLEKYFAKQNPYPDAYERESLAEQTGESPERIKNWFSNARSRKR